MKTLDKLARLQLDRAVLKMCNSETGKKKLRAIQSKIDEITEPHWMKPRVKK